MRKIFLALSLMLTAYQAQAMELAPTEDHPLAVPAAETELRDVPAAPAVAVLAEPRADAPAPAVLAPAAPELQPAVIVVPEIVRGRDIPREEVPAPVPAPAEEQGWGQWFWGAIGENLPAPLTKTIEREEALKAAEQIRLQEVQGLEQQQQQKQAALLQLLQPQGRVMPATKESIITLLMEYAKQNKFDLKLPADKYFYLARAKQVLPQSNFWTFRDNQDVEDILQELTHDDPALDKVFAAARPDSGLFGLFSEENSLSNKDILLPENFLASKLKLYKEYTLLYPFDANKLTLDKYLQKAQETLEKVSPYLFFCLKQMGQESQDTLIAGLRALQAQGGLQPAVAAVPASSVFGLKKEIIDVLTNYAKQNRFNLQTPEDRKFYLERAQQVIPKTTLWTYGNDTEKLGVLQSLKHDDNDLQSVFVAAKPDVTWFGVMNKPTPLSHLTIPLPERFFIAQSNLYKNYMDNHPPTEPFAEYVQTAQLALEQAYPYLFFCLKAFGIQPLQKMLELRNQQEKTHKEKQQQYALRQLMDDAEQRKEVVIDTLVAFTRTNKFKLQSPEDKKFYLQRAQQITQRDDQTYRNNKKMVKILQDLKHDDPALKRFFAAAAPGKSLLGNEEPNTLSHNTVQLPDSFINRRLNYYKDYIRNNQLNDQTTEQLNKYLEKARDNLKKDLPYLFFCLQNFKLEKLTAKEWRELNAQLSEKSAQAIDRQKKSLVNTIEEIERLRSNFLNAFVLQYAKNNNIAVSDIVWKEDSVYFAQAEFNLDQKFGKKIREYSNAMLDTIEEFTPDDPRATPEMLKNIFAAGLEKINALKTITMQDLTQATTAITSGLEYKASVGAKTFGVKVQEAASAVGGFIKGLFPPAQKEQPKAVLASESQQPTAALAAAVVTPQAQLQIPVERQKQITQSIKKQETDAEKFDRLMSTAESQQQRNDEPVIPTQLQFTAAFTERPRRAVTAEPFVQETFEEETEQDYEQEEFFEPQSEVADEDETESPLLTQDYSATALYASLYEDFSDIENRYTPDVWNTSPLKDERYTLFAQHLLEFAISLQSLLFDEYRTVAAKMPMQMLVVAIRLLKNNPNPTQINNAMKQVRVIVNKINTLSEAE